MIKVFGLGRGRGSGASSIPSSSSRGETPAGNNPANKIHPGQLRMQTELSELELPLSCKIEFPDSNDLMRFNVFIRPDDGFWRDGRYKFTFLIKPLYPHDPPKVKCETQIYHPNIDLEGNVCLNILREDWKPILSISAVVYGLIHLLSEPNPNDPLNQEAAELLRNNRPEFARTVARTLRGGFHQVVSMSAGDFDKAVAYVRSLPKGQSTLTQAQQLSFYANFKQATVGPCKLHGGSQPWAVQLEARAKWDAWNVIGEKDPESAKSDYVKMLDECVPSWRN